MFPAVAPFCTGRGGATREMAGRGGVCMTGDWVWTGDRERNRDRERERQTERETKRESSDQSNKHR